MDELWGSDDDDDSQSSPVAKKAGSADDVWGSDSEEDEATAASVAAKRDEKNLRAKHYKVISHCQSVNPNLNSKLSWQDIAFAVWLALTRSFYDYI
jgi:hypothetical protein